MFFEYDKEAKESLDEYDFLVDGHIYIPPHIWREVYFKFTKKELIAHLSNIIEENKLPYPAPEYKEGVLRKDFKRLQTEVNVVKEGEWVYYFYGSGDLWQKGSYKNGKMVDKWYFYNNKGNLKEIRYFSPVF